MNSTPFLKANNPIDFIPLLSKMAGEYAFLFPTSTGLSKSIMDATAGVRWFLNVTGLHDYARQQQGPENKVLLSAFFVKSDSIVSSIASLYRPRTKHGDPRIWFKGLNEYASAGDLLVLVSIQKTIYVLNLSNPSVISSIQEKGIAWRVLQESRRENESTKLQLLARLKEIHDRGWIPSVTPSDPGVGDTLEHALGISRNNSRDPDFHGIELKASRTSRQGGNRQETRSTLFTRVPDSGLSYREIVEEYGKIQTPRGGTTPRLQLYETFSCKRINGYGLFLNCNEKKERVEIHQAIDGERKSDSPSISSWSYETLKQALAQKHPETFWISADSKEIEGKEYFLYQTATYTSKPKIAILPELIANGVVTLDLAAHVDPATNKWRDHGMLWKIWKGDLPLLMGEEEVFQL